MNFLVLAVLFLIAIPTKIFAENTEEAFSKQKILIIRADIDPDENCGLHEFGYSTIKNPHMFKGKPQQGSCVVNLKWREFTKMFSSCSLSGFDSNSRTSSCQFRFKSNDWVEFSAKFTPDGKYDYLTCDFICIEN